MQGVEPETMEGDWRPERVVILEFPSKEKAKEFLVDPGAQSLFALRHESTTSKLILVEGCFKEALPDEKGCRIREAGRRKINAE